MKESKNNKENIKKNSYYTIEVKKEITKSKICIISVIVVIVVVIIIGTILKAINVLNIENQNKKYQAQIEQLKKEEIAKQEEERKKAELERKRKLPNLTQKGKENMEKIYKSETKRVFLTFDDGPSNNTASILDILKQENVKVTFFELGTRVEASPELVKRAYDEGHFIASHRIFTCIFTNICINSKCIRRI